MRKFIGLLTMCAASACVITSRPILIPSTMPGPAVVSYQPASAAEYQPFLAPGTATIKGQAFLRTNGGEVRTGAGSSATLDPLTSLARDWLAKVGTIADRFSEAPTDTLFQRARRSTVIDAQGNFAFSGLSAGKYAVRTTVYWIIGSAPQGGLLFDTITVAAGETKQLILHESATQFEDRAGAAGSGPPIYTSDQLRDRKYTVVQRISETSCRPKDATADAISKLRANAAQGNFDGIVDVSCIVKTDLMQTGGCASQLICSGDGIRWAK